MSAPLTDLHHSSFLGKPFQAQPSPYPDFKRPDEVPATRPGIIEELYGTKPKSFKQWEEAAKENIRQIQRVWLPISACLGESSSLAFFALLNPNP
jgi:hypothetical protein